MADTTPIRILLIEDNPGDARLIREMLAEVAALRFELHHVERFADAMEALGKESFGVALLDLSLPDSQWFGAFAQIRGRAPNLPIIVLTGLDDEKFAARAAQEGAADYLNKGTVTGVSLVASIGAAMKAGK
jgi:DNA-binding response OmpR family regulator